MLVFAVCRLAAQQSYNDAQAWFNLYLEKKISKRFALHLNQQDRWTYNVSRFNLAYADVGVTFKFTKDLKLLLDYVYAYKQTQRGSYGIRHQYYAALIWKKDFRRWRFMYRNMFQGQYNNFSTSLHGYLPYYYDRSKFTLKYGITKRWTAYIAEELYTPLNSPRSAGNLRYITVDRTRSFAGVFFNTRRGQWLELYFMYQYENRKGIWMRGGGRFPLAIPRNYFVYGLGYSIEF